MARVQLVQRGGLEGLRTVHILAGVIAVTVDPTITRIAPRKGQQAGVASMLLLLLVMVMVMVVVRRRRRVSCSNNFLGGRGICRSGFLHCGGSSSLLEDKTRLNGHGGRQSILGPQLGSTPLVRILPLVIST